MKHYLLALLISSTAAAVVAGEEKYGPMNVDGGHITCKSFSGDEIKKQQRFAATSDRFFKENSIQITRVSGWAPKKYGCDIVDVERKDLTLNSDIGQVPVSVIQAFSIYAYADCGTDAIKFAGKTASIECDVAATLVEYRK
jgi:hypothetical protein